MNHLEARFAKTSAGAINKHQNHKTIDVFLATINYLTTIFNLRAPLTTYFIVPGLKVARVTFVRWSLWLPQGSVERMKSLHFCPSSLLALFIPPAPCVSILVATACNILLICKVLTFERGSEACQTWCANPRTHENP